MRGRRSLFNNREDMQYQELGWKTNQSAEESSKLQVTVKTINGGQKSIEVSRNTTGLQLKKLIYQECCQSLEVQHMSIIYEGTVISNKKKLSSVNIVNGKNIIIKQDKITVAEVSNIIADAEGVDVINEEKGVAKMACGHWISRGTLISLIRSIISTNKHEIRCPFPDENDLICSAKWEFKDCKKIGVFTKQELQEFQEGLSMKWIQKYTKNCPFCHSQIFKGDLKTNRVFCPSCKYGDFCYLCLKKWVGQGNDRCGNGVCMVPEDLLVNCPWNREFLLKVDDEMQTFQTPKYRACTHCHQIVENYKACKHTKCVSCGNSFCWVCLGSPQKGVWPCGSYNEYCGRVAQTQNI